MNKTTYNGNELYYDTTDKKWYNPERGGMGGGGCLVFTTDELREDIFNKISDYHSNMLNILRFICKETENE